MYDYAVLKKLIREEIIKKLGNAVSYNKPEKTVSDPISKAVIYGDEYQFNRKMNKPGN